MAIASYGQTTVTIGAGTVAGGTSDNGAPIYRSSATSGFDFSQSVMLYTAADLNSAGIFNGATISSIAFNKTSTGGLVATAAASWSITMRNTSSTSLTTLDTYANLTAGSTLVYSNPAVDASIIPPAAGFVVLQLTTPFVYTGGSIEIGSNWDVSAVTGSPSTGSFNWAHDVVPGIQARGLSASSAITVNLSSAFGRRYQAQFTFTGGATCTTPPTAGTAVNLSTDVCTGSTNMLAVTGDAPAAGASYQWEFAADGMTFTPIAGATAVTYSFMLSGSTTGSYRRTETCSGVSASSTPVAVTRLIIQPDASPETFTTYLPNCWTEAQGLLGATTTLTGTTSNWIADGFLNNGTTGAARIEIFTTTIDEWLISPTYNLTGNEQLVFDLGLTFWNTTAPAGTTGVDDRFAVVISTDDGVTWTDANALAIWDNAGSTNVYNNISNTGETIILDLSAYSGNVRFGFYGESTVANADNNVYVDNVQVRTTPNCLDVTNLSLATATTNTASLTWDSNNPNTAGRFEYLVDSMNSFPTGPDAMTAPTGTFPVGNSSATVPVAQMGQITGLTPATRYDVYVREVCTVTDRSPWTGAISFVTLCDPIASFSENFDSVATPNLPICWSSFNTVLATGTSPEVLTSTAADNSLPNGVAMDSNSADGSTVTADQLLITPQLSNLSAGTHRLRFFLDASVTTSSVQVGTITDPLDPTTFTAISTIPATTTFTEHIINFDTYTGADTYIAFKHIFTTTFDFIYLDDIVWEAIPACQEPTQFAISSFTDTTVDLSWVNNNASTVSSIEFGLPMFTLGSGTVVAGMGNTATVTGLMEQTTYQFYVTQDCSATGDGTSVTIGPISVTTACSPVMAPYTVDFDSFTTSTTFSEENCWTETSAGAFTWDVDGGGTTISSSTGPSGANTGTKYFFTESSSGTFGDTAALRTPLVNLTGLTNPSITFYTHLYGAAIGTFEAFVIANGTETSVFSVTGQQQTIETDPWEQRVVDLAAFAGQVVAVEFRHTTANSGSGFSFNGDAALDDVSFGELPQCIDVSGVTAGMITATTAQISWTENNTPAAAAWEVVVLPTGTAAPAPGATNATMMPFNATGLTSSTAYDVYVRPACATTFAAPISFRTLAACGDTVYDTGGASGNYSANEDFTITYFPDVAGNVVTLNFTLVDLETCCDDLAVYDGVDIMATPFTTDLIAPASFRATNASGAITIRFTSDGSVQRAGWAANYTCAAPPSCLEPTGLTASNVSDTMASLSWTSGGSGETAWDVEIVLAGTAPTGTPTNAGVANPFNATGLTAQTAYDYYVRAACSATDFSAFSGPFSFTTQCAPVTVFPVSVDFTNNVPNSCWTEAGMGEFAAGPSGFGASDWRSSRSYTNISGTVVPSNAINLWQNVDREWLISETYDLSSGSFNLAVEVAVVNFSFSGTSTATDTAVMGSDDSVVLAISSDNGTTWTALTTWNVGNQPATTGTEFIANLSAFTGNVQFAFFASDGTVDDAEDYDFLVGSLRIETTASNDDTQLASNLRLYPNPVSGDELNITFSNSSQDAVTVSVVNMTGQVIRTQRFDQASTTLTLDNMSTIATGVYFVNVTQGAQTATLKFIKQ